jgi:solute carrier family 41
MNELFSLGDVVTLTFLSFMTTWLYQIRQHIWMHSIILILFIILVPIFVHFSYNNEYVRNALTDGWTPIILAMIISSTGGYIMGFAVEKYEDIAVFQPVVNGVGGNLVAIFSSRLSTALHRTSTLGSRATWTPQKWYQYPFDTFFNRSSKFLELKMISILFSFKYFIFKRSGIKDCNCSHHVSIARSFSFLFYNISS